MSYQCACNSKSGCSSEFEVRPRRRGASLMRPRLPLEARRRGKVKPMGGAERRRTLSGKKDQGEVRGSQRANRPLTKATQRQPREGGIGGKREKGDEQACRVCVPIWQYRPQKIDLIQRSYKEQHRSATPRVTETHNPVTPELGKQRGEERARGAGESNYSGQ